MKGIYKAIDANVISELEIIDQSFVQMKNSGSLKWEIEVEMNGRYELYFRYRSFFGDKAQRIIINQKEYGIGFPYSFGEWAEIKKTILLKKGINEVELKKDNGYIDLDYLRIGRTPGAMLEPIFEIPTISPAQNIFYLDHPRDLFIKLNKNGHHLVSLTCNDQSMNYHLNDYPYVEDTVYIVISGENLLAYHEGEYNILLHFLDGTTIPFNLSILGHSKKWPLSIVALDVRHGYATLMILPNGETLLIDSGDSHQAKHVVMPFLDRHRIKELDYYCITHYHDDHCGCKDEIISNYKVKQFFDYKDFKSGETFHYNDINITILNSYDDDADENSRSLSFRLEYKGFVYIHGGDIYGKDQVRIMKRFPELVRAHVYNANHHFHGSVDVNYLRKTDPNLVLVSAEEAIYARGAYMHHYKEHVHDYLKSHRARLVEDLLTLEVGHTVISISDENNWSYATYKNTRDCIVAQIVGL